MTKFRYMSRLLAVVALSVWGAMGVVAPAHAAEEDIHHATQHDGDFETTSSDGAPADEGSVHPEHATHCHSGACHFHAMSRGALDLATTHLMASGVTGPPSDVIRQTLLSSLFRPPRI